MQPEATHSTTPVGLYALELRSECWQELVQWYREAIGLRVLVRIVEDEYALLAAGSARLAILGRREVEQATSRSTLVFEVADLDSAITRLRKAGAEPSEPRQHGEGFRETTLNDPDGNHLRLFQWPMKR